jgi:pimeloyl-ACP methyl ester carboxylesterase
MPKIATIVTAAAAAVATMFGIGAARAEAPLMLAKNGSFYVGGKMTEIDGRALMSGHMYVEYMIPARKTRPYPIIFVHGGLRTGTNFTGTFDGKEGWAQYFVRQGYAVYVVDQVGRGRSPIIEKAYGPARMGDVRGVQKRYAQEEKYNLWPQARLHAAWPGGGEMESDWVKQLSASQAVEIESFHTQQELNRDALVALVDKIGPSIILGHSQAGAFLWPVADARPKMIKAILGIEPNGPPVRAVDFIGAPDWFKYGEVALSYGVTDVPIAYTPPIKDASELKFVQQEKADGEGLVRCFEQAAPARQLTNLRDIPILVLVSEASYHAPYDHCTVKYLQQAGAKPSFIKLADLGIKGDSHVLMLEKNSKDIAAVIAKWLATSVSTKQAAK